MYDDDEFEVAQPKIAEPDSPPKLKPDAPEPQPFKSKRVFNSDLSALDSIVKSGVTDNVQKVDANQPQISFPTLQEPFNNQSLTEVNNACRDIDTYISPNGPNTSPNFSQQQPFGVSQQQQPLPSLPSLPQPTNVSQQQQPYIPPMVAKGKLISKILIKQKAYPEIKDLVDANGREYKDMSIQELELLLQTMDGFINTLRTQKLFKKGYFATISALETLSKYTGDYIDLEGLSESLEKTEGLDGCLYECSEEINNYIGDYINNPFYLLGAITLGSAMEINRQNTVSKHGLKKVPDRLLDADGKLIIPDFVHSDKQPQQENKEILASLKETLNSNNSVKPITSENKPKIEDNVLSDMDKLLSLTV